MGCCRIGRQIPCSGSSCFPKKNNRFRFPVVTCPGVSVRATLSWTTIFSTNSAAESGPSSMVVYACRVGATFQRFGGFLRFESSSAVWRHVLHSFVSASSSAAELKGACTGLQEALPKRRNSAPNAGRFMNVVRTLLREETYPYFY